MTTEQDEVWRDVPKYMGIYQASSLGRVRRVLAVSGTPSGYILKPVIDHKGYERLRLSVGGKKSSDRVHYMVASAFHGERPSGMQVNHIDGDKRNNHPENLEYVTNAENMRHAFANGLFKDRGFEGEGHPMAKNTNQQIRLVKLMLRDTRLTAPQIADHASCSKSVVYMVKYGKWASVKITDDDKLDAKYFKPREYVPIPPEYLANLAKNFYRGSED